MLDVREYTFTADEQRRCADASRALLTHVRALRTRAAGTPGQTHMWHETITFHALLHIALQAALINPRIGWCYMDEHFMRVLKLIAEACMLGTHSHTVAGSTAGKWALCVAQRWSRE